MSIIGSGPGSSPGSVSKITALRPVGSSDAGTTQAPVPPAAVAPKPAASSAGLFTSTALDAGAMPVDQSRVAEIKQAIQSNSYPVLPTKIGDAMIAAGLLLRMPK